MQNLLRFLQRAAMTARIVVGGHIVNWPWLPAAERRRRRGEVTSRAVLRYLSRYIPVIESVADADEQPQTQEDDSQYVFTIWLQGEQQAPPIVRACLRSMRCHFGRRAVVLDATTLFDWIELPAHVVDKWRSGKIRPAHFADICRVELLYRYGGVWIDSTAFVTAPVPQQIMDREFFIYMAGEHLHGSYAFVQNCFFRARRGCHILRVWRRAILQYWMEENSPADYFVHQLLFRLSVEHNAAAADIFARMPRMVQDPTHALWPAYRNEPYDEELFRRVTAGAFFQKTEYRSLQKTPPLTGSFAEAMINMYR